MKKKNFRKSPLTKIFAKNSQSGRHYQKFKMQKLKSPLFPIDSNLIRIKQITTKLLQETMLEDLQRDVVQASVKSDGKVTLKLTPNNLYLNSSK